MESTSTGYRVTGDLTIRGVTRSVILQVDDGGRVRDPRGYDRAGFSAHTAAGAIDRIIDLYPPENRGQVQLALADCLRGVIVQVLLRRIAGGRVPAREVLLNTPAVSSCRTTRATCGRRCYCPAARRRRLPRS